MHAGKKLSTTICQDLQILDEVQQVYAWLDVEVCGSIHFTSCPNCADVLMDVRNVFQHYSHDLDADRLLHNFYALLPRLEASYYLVSFRIRRWLEFRFYLILEGLKPGSEKMELALNSTQKSFSDIKTAAEIDYLCANDFTHQPSDILLKVLFRN